MAKNNFSFVDNHPCHFNRLPVNISKFKEPLTGKELKKMLE